MNVAVVQASPVPFNKAETIDVVASRVEQCSKADLVLFPEAFIPVYPRGFHFGAPVGNRTDEGRALWQLLTDNAVVIPSADTDRLGEIAKRFDCYLVIGVNERDVQSGSLYCTLLYFHPDGRLLASHRKLKPTGAERVIWAEGDGRSLHTIQTPFGVLGGLICWENYMPLARMAMYQQGVSIYVAPTADQRETWLPTMQHIAMEGRCFVLSCNQFLTKSSIDPNTPGYADLNGQTEIMSKGGSLIIDPFGNVVEGPVWDKEMILEAELDLSLVQKSRMDFSVVGHYSRNDVFDLKIPHLPDTRS